MALSDDLMRVLLPAAVGLLGTILGLWLGHWRWSSELRMTKRRAFDARRHAAYAELWNVVEGAHIVIRTARPDAKDVQKLEQEINVFCLRNAIVLDPADAKLSTGYFNAVVRLSNVIAESGSRELEERFAMSVSFASSEIAHVQGLVDATENAARLRDELSERIRAVMIETSYASSAGGA
jgi:hypothetical protein